VRVDEPRRNDEARRVDRSGSGDAARRRIPDECDAVAPNADVGTARRGARSIDDRAAADEEVDLLLCMKSRSARCAGNQEGEESEAHDSEGFSHGIG
jgi:hypothetical protein